MPGLQDGSGNDKEDAFIDCDSTCPQGKLAIKVKNISIITPITTVKT